MKEMSDPFFANIRKTNADTFEVTIDINIMRFEGWKEGDTLRLIAQKVGKKE
jgi:hypothetical protein